MLRCYGPLATLPPILIEDSPFRTMALRHYSEPQWDKGSHGALLLLSVFRSCDHGSPVTGDRHRQLSLLLWEHLIAAQLSLQKPSATPPLQPWGYILWLEKQPGWLPASREGEF